MSESHVNEEGTEKTPDYLKNDPKVGLPKSRKPWNKKSKQYIKYFDVNR